MIRSMTGYGRSLLERDGKQLTVEIWSVNHRYLDVSIRLPKPLLALEPAVRKLVQEHVDRGKITLTLGCEELTSAQGRLKLNAARVKDYLAVAEELRKSHGVPGTLDVAAILAIPELVTDEGDGLDLDRWLEISREGIEGAIAAIMTLRSQEGAEIASDILARLSIIETLLGQVEERAPGRLLEMRERLKARIAQLLAGGEVDPYRLEQEVVFHADRLDYTEECVRLRAHMKHFRSFATDPESAGRKLNFLLQEMSREVTTIGSKANDAEVAIAGVRMKEELERIREQVQNVE
jgi:uncharacterized protein (TIGR00255 family)